MSERFEDTFDPYQEMRAFYRLDDPTEEQQFRFVESMKYLIDTAFFESDVIAFSYNLAKYYLDIKKFELAKKYFELGAQFDEACSKEALGLIWYYGLTGEQDYEKAYQYFAECETKRSRFMIADMYHDGSYVRRSKEKCREIIEELFEGVREESEDARFSIRETPYNRKP